MLIFFDDILIDNKSVEEHLENVKLTLGLLRKHQLFAKCSKCKFGCMEVGYLGHLILGQGLRVDLEKLKAMLDWPQPKSLKALRGFLGLMGYYKRFVKHYCSKAVGLTA